MLQVHCQSVRPTILRGTSMSQATLPKRSKVAGAPVRKQLLAPRRAARDRNARRPVPQASLLAGTVAAGVRLLFGATFLYASASWFMYRRARQQASERVMFLVVGRSYSY